MINYYFSELIEKRIQQKSSELQSLGRYLKTWATTASYL
jgi:hypothetical protein